MTTKEQFQKDMYDYANINEYYSYFGNIVYISSSYYDNLDYFLILRTPKSLAVVTIPAATKKKFASKKTRKDVVSDLNELESTIHWVVPAAFTMTINNILQQPNFPDKNELIRLKNNDINLWNRFFVEDAIRKFKLDHTLLSRGINFDHTIKAGRMTTYTTADGIYGTSFGLMSEWVSGNPFFDIKIKYFSDIKTRRLNYYDISEFAELLSVLANRNEKPSLKAISQFSS